MRIVHITRVSLGFAIAAGLLSQINGQHSKQPILKAPTAGQTATERTSRALEPHGYTNRIVGGKVSPGRPFIAALLYEKDGKQYQYCGASVIGDRWLLTAAHCEVKKGELAIINRSDLGSVGGVLRRVERVMTHQKYDSGTHDNDIALLYLSAEIPSTIQRVNIAAPPQTGTGVLVAGWGRTSETGPPSLSLLEVNVPIIASDPDCKAKYPELTGNMVCAGKTGQDSCQGDSGGPLFLVGNDVEQFGIVSYGVGCGRSGWPGVYTKVGVYQDWIASTMHP